MEKQKSGGWLLALAGLIIVTRIVARVRESRGAGALATAHVWPAAAAALAARRVRCVCVAALGHFIAYDVHQSFKNNQVF
jgi:hypothetical protein